MILLTSPNCPECTKVKDLLRKAGVKFREVSVTSDEGLKLGIAYGLTHVPALILDENHIYIGFDEIARLIRSSD